MPPSARRSRLGDGDGLQVTGGLSEPLLGDNEVTTPVSQTAERRNWAVANLTPPNTTMRRATLGIPPSPTPAEWSALRQQMRVRAGELYVTPTAGARPTTQSGIPLLRDAQLFRSINHERTESGSRKSGLGSPLGFNSGNEPDSADESAERREQRLRLAVEYVRDALDGSTHLTFRRESKFARNIAWVQRSFFYNFTVRVLLLAHMSLVFVEPKTRMDLVENFSKHKLRVLLVTELCIAWSFLSVVGLDLHRLGFERWQTKHWRFVFLGSALFIFTDVLTALITASIKDQVNGGYKSSSIWLYSRPSRCLRPLLLIAHHRSLRQLVSSALKTLLKLKSTVKLLTVLVIAYSTLGVQMYQGAYDVADVDDRGNFDNVFDASIAMTVLLTTENFPDVMRPSLGAYAVEVNKIPKFISAFFFVSFIITGVWLGMSLWTSVIFENYKAQHRCKIENSKTHEQKALITAYSVLQDSPVDEPLPMATWIQLAKAARPNLSENHARALFATLDKDGDEKIDIDEFLGTVELLRSSVGKAHVGGRSGDVETGGDDGESSLGVGVKHLLACVVNSKAFALHSKFLAYAQVVVLCFRRRGAGNGENMTIDVLDSICVVLLLLEVSIKCVSYFLKVDTQTQSDSKSVFLQKSGFDIFVGAASTLFLLPKVPVHYRRILAPVRVFRLCSVDVRQLEILQTFRRCGGVILTLLATLTCVRYGYAVVGLELFGSDVTSQRGYCVSGDETSASTSIKTNSSYIAYPFGLLQVGYRTANGTDHVTPSSNSTSTVAPCLDLIENFETPWNAFLALFQVTTSNNWHDILYPNASAMKTVSGDFGRVVAVLYFVTFYFVAVLLLVNVLTSLVLEMFGLQLRERGNEVEDDEEDEGLDGTGDAPLSDAQNTPNSRTTLVTVEGETYFVTRADDFTKDLLLEGADAKRERRALLKSLEQVESQIARRKYERVVGVLETIRRGRSGNGGDGNTSGSVQSVQRQNSFRRTVSRMMKVSSRNELNGSPPQIDLHGELDNLTNDEWADVAEVLGNTG